MPITVHVHYFALLREQRGLAAETLMTEAPDAATLYETLRGEHRFTLPVDRLRVALNGDFVPWPAPLTDGAQIVFIPPVAGG
tara:strand:- start:324 stop:569 length:246 start_codon:yes stop_codon:yes gene_type:complete